MKTKVKPVTKALPDIKLAPSVVNPAWLKGIKFLSGPYFRLAMSCTGMELLNPEPMVKALKSAMDGKSRLILAFRHPYGEEPQFLSYLFLKLMAKEFKKLDLELPGQPWLRFIHGYEVPRWGGALIRAVLPRMGALPVHHSKMDREGLERIRSSLMNGPWPVALAPEGQVSYNARTLPRLEQGVVRLGLDAVKKLKEGGQAMGQALGQGLDIVLLPLSIRLRYSQKAQASLDKNLRLAERLLRLYAGGLQAGGLQAHNSGSGLAGRIIAIRDSSLELAEKFYGLKPGSNSVSARIESLVLGAINTAEQILGLPEGSGHDIDRVYRIRQEGWDRIFVAGREEILNSGLLAETLMNRKTGEAWYAMRHMEMADLGWYYAKLDHEGFAEDGFESMVEYAQNVLDFCNRLLGGNFNSRVQIKPRFVQFLPALPINLTEIEKGYDGDRKKSVAAAQAVLESAFLESASLLFPPKSI